MLPIVLHMNNLRPMYEKLPHGEQAKWWTHTERFDIMQQPVEFRRYIMDRYHVVATLASHMVISSTARAAARKTVATSPGTDRASRGAVLEVLWPPLLKP
jgi:hypothetical protein